MSSSVTQCALPGEVEAEWKVTSGKCFAVGGMNHCVKVKEDLLASLDSLPDDYLLHQTVVHFHQTGFKMTSVTIPPERHPFGW